MRKKNLFTFPIKFGQETRYLSKQANRQAQITVREKKKEKSCSSKSFSLVPLVNLYNLYRIIRVPYLLLPVLSCNNIVRIVQVQQNVRQEHFVFLCLDRDARYKNEATKRVSLSLTLSLTSSKEKDKSE